MRTGGPGARASLAKGKGGRETKRKRKKRFGSRVAKELPTNPVGDHEISADGHGEEREVLVMRVPCKGV